MSSNCSHYDLCQVQVIFEGWHKVCSDNGWQVMTTECMFVQAIHRRSGSPLIDEVKVPLQLPHHVAIFVFIYFVVQYSCITALWNQTPPCLTFFLDFLGGFLPENAGAPLHAGYTSLFMRAGMVSTVEDLGASSLQTLIPRRPFVSSSWWFPMARLKSV